MSSVKGVPADALADFRMSVEPVALGNLSQEELTVELQKESTLWRAENHIVQMK